MFVATSWAKFSFCEPRLRCFELFGEHYTRDKEVERNISIPYHNHQLYKDEL